MIASGNAVEKVEEITDLMMSERSYDSFVGFEKFEVRKTFENIFGNSEINYIYPKYLFEEDSDEMIFYVLHGKSISEVKRFSEANSVSKHYIVETYPLAVVGIRYQWQEKLGRQGVNLELKLDNGKFFMFDSKEDSNQTWREPFTNIIQEIYNHLIK